MPLLTQVKKDDPVNINALIMGEVQKPTLHYRTLGSDSFTSIPMEHKARGVYRAVIPAQQDDFEWYVTAQTNLGDVIFPSTAGASAAESMFQTVIVW